MLAILCGWFLISGFRNYAASQGVIVRPNLFSKLATILIFPAIILAVLDFRPASWLFLLGIGCGVASLVWIALVRPESRALLSRGLFPRQG